jgi:putative SOS response-associated peptidase YedK
MCFHYEQIMPLAELEKRFQARAFDPNVFDVSPHYNGFGHPMAPVITNEKPHEIQLAYWGLLPGWAKDISFANNTLNARWESLHDKPSFRNILHQRCLIPATGFFEWKWLTPDGKKKEKYLCKVAGEDIFAFGGLWSNWINKETGEVMLTFAIITVEAQGLMREIHNSKQRQPLVIPREQEQAWLNGENPDFTKPAEWVAERAL